MTNVTARLADFASGSQLADLPAAVRDRARLLAADSIAIALRAWREAESTPSHVRALVDLGETGVACSVFGSDRRFGPGAAAELNGALIHSLDFDDTYAAGALHPSTTVLPAVLAAAQLEGASGADALTALVVGLEAVCRIGVALNASDHYDRGFHPTATCGTFGAALAASRVLGLDAAQTASALGIALSQAAGSLQFLSNGAWTKRFQVGHAARAGLHSAYLARCGYLGPEQALEGRHGFMRAYAPQPSPEKAVEELGRQWRTLDIAVKPYPACRFAHAAVDALIALRAEERLQAGRIRRIHCGLPTKGILLVGEPIEDKRRVATVVEGQFSMPFAAAVAVLDGRLDWQSYSRHIGSPAVDALMQRVDVSVDPDAEAGYPASFGAKVRVTLDDGRELERFVASPKGEPDNFVTQAELRSKFDGLVEGILDDGRRDALFCAIHRLDELPSVDPLFGL